MVGISQRRIGLTGGIACGKSTVAEYLNCTYGLPILDADRLAKTALEGEMLDRVVAHFGPSILSNLAQKTLDRPALARLVFSNPPERQWLEAQIHPSVRQALIRGAQLHAPETVVLVVPLLFEAQMHDLVTEVWVVSCTESTMIRRLQSRNQLTVAESQCRIQSQMPLAQKCALADVVLQNEGTLGELWAQIDRVYPGFTAPAKKGDRLTET